MDVLRTHTLPWTALAHMAPSLPPRIAPLRITRGSSRKDSMEEGLSEDGLPMGEDPSTLR